MDSNFNTAACAAKAWTLLQNAAFRATPHHSALRRMTPHLCRSCCGIFRTKELGQATLLHKTIHLSAATVDSVCHLCSKTFFNLWISFRILSAGCPWTVRSNSMGKAEAA
jgi:hypothetical protein